MYMLDIKGVCVSAGSACNSVSLTPSHVLAAIGLSEEEAARSIRISVSDQTEIHDIREAAKIMAGCISLLRRANGMA